MITMDTSVKIQKTLNNRTKSEVKVSNESDCEDVEDSNTEEEEEIESGNEEMDTDKDDQISSGIEGDESGASENDDNSNTIKGKAKANPGWADAMRKILNTNKPKKKKTIVLSKAKKLNEVVSKPKEEVVPFEIEAEDGKIKKETIKIETKDTDKSEKDSESRKRRKDLGLRLKPSVLDRERERYLQKIATNGVVQLFNAVRQQQKEIEDRLVEAGPAERKREKALKNIDRRAFLDVLMGGTNKIAVEDNTEELKEEKEEDENSRNSKDDKVWSVLRDDFVMGAKLKDWNKHNSDDDDSSAPEEMDSD